MENDTTAPPDDMMEMGQYYGRCTHHEHLPGAGESAWRCGRGIFHGGPHAFHPEFHPVLGPVIRLAKAVR